MSLPGGSLIHEPWWLSGSIWVVSYNFESGFLLFSSSVVCFVFVVVCHLIVACVAVFFGTNLFTVVFVGNLFSFV